MKTALKYGLAAAAIIGISACGAKTEPVEELNAVQIEQAGQMTLAEADALYGEILAEYITAKDGINFFGYGDVTEADKTRLKTYIAALEAMGVEDLSEDEEMAFWFNLYNAKTIDIILDNYPLKSIRSLGFANRGPWDNKVMTVAGVGEMSLKQYRARYAAGQLGRAAHPLCGELRILWLPEPCCQTMECKDARRRSRRGGDGLYQPSSRAAR